MTIAAGLSLLPVHGYGQFSGDVQKVHALHEQGVQGGEEAVLECIALAEALLDADPDDQMVRVFLGSAYTLRSRDLGPGPEKLSTLKLGGRLMDEAVEAAPEDPQVRLIRAINNSQLPRVFGRRKPALADFDWILSRVAEDPASLTVDEKQAMYYFAGLAQPEKKIRRELWGKGAVLNPGSPLGKKMTPR